jgi:hypothetical protein
VGLFGTVWGIMSAFTSLGNVQQATLAMVAPGIAEALIATAVGLFAAIPAVVAFNRYADQVGRLEVRYDVLFPSLYQIRQRGLALSPISYATAHMAALFVKYFPRDLAGVFPPGAIPLENRQAILKDAKSRGIHVTTKITRKEVLEEDETEEPVV